MDFNFDPNTLFTAIAALAAFLTVVSLAFPLLQGDRLATRLKSVAERREELRRKSREALKAGGQLRPQSDGWMKQAVEQLKLERIVESPGIKEKLVMAGMRGQRPFIVFMLARFVTPILFFAAAVIYLFVFDTADRDTLTQFMIVLVAFTTGYYLPPIWVGNVVTRRQQKIQRAFPDSLDLLLICVESGMSIEAAFNKVAEEIGVQSVELAEEMALTTAELSYLPERRLAYENLGKRTGLDGVKAVTTALIQSERYGTSLGQALRVMGDENRKIRMQMAEKKAAALPAKLTVPMIAFFLPVLFVVILGPAIMSFQGSGFGG